MTIMTKKKKTNLLAIPSQDDPCPHVIQQLEELLEAAKAGTIKNVFVIAERRQEDPLFVQAGEQDALKTLGLLNWAASRWLETTLVSYMEDDI